jgi:hypothetical protein
MPTPFTHLAFAQRALRDPALDEPIRALLNTERGAFLLGSVAADARVGAGAPRENTHFYAYGEMTSEKPWQVMLRHNPDLWQPRDAAHAAFVAGYVAHLAMDEHWSRHMVAPHFFHSDWVSSGHRFLMLHVILITMDERDFALLEGWQAGALRSAQPRHWLAFMPDIDLCAWQDLIYRQIKPEGASETYAIFAPRVRMTADELRGIMDTEEKLDDGLWQYVPRATLAAIERDMYRFALAQLRAYLGEVERRQSR